MIHYFVTYSRDPRGNPLDLALAATGVSYRLFGARLHSGYRWRWQLLLIGLPRLIIAALVFSWKSLVQERIAPDKAILGSHLEVLVYSFFSKFVRKKVSIVYLGFIYTSRSSGFLRIIRLNYFRWIFRFVDCVICYSSSEVLHYAKIFPDASEKFRFVPLGLFVPDAGVKLANELNEPVFLSAGRSGRDYALLTKIFAKNGLPLRIVCDLDSAKSGCVVADNIRWLNSCYGENYIKELWSSSVVVVTLAVNEISAGQMVMLQAMAYGKPVIITRIPTLDDYANDSSGVCLIEPGSEKDLERAVQRFSTDCSMRREMSERSFATYSKNHTISAFVNNLLAAIDPTSSRNFNGG